MKTSKLNNVLRKTTRLIWGDPKVPMLVLMSLPLSCGTDVGNPVVDMKFSIYDSGSSATFDKGIAHIAPPGLLIDKAWVAVERIRLRDATNCEGNSRDEFEGPFVVDMLSTDSNPSLSGLELNSSTYCRLEFRWKKLVENEVLGAPPELTGASVLLEGERADGIRFILKSDKGNELRLDARNDTFTIDELSSSLFVAFDVQDLFDGVNMDAAEVVDGSIRIQNNSNETLLRVFESNLDEMAKLFDDDDGDGELDPEERDSTDVLAE